MNKIILPITIELKGSCVGTTSTLIERTVSKALYCRSDKYWETFIIKVVPEMVYVEGKWKPTGNMTEVYPKDNAFGVTAWCGKEESIRNIYLGLQERRIAVSDFDVSRFFELYPQGEAMGPLNEDNVSILKQSQSNNLKYLNHEK